MKAINEDFIGMVWRVSQECARYRNCPWAIINPHFLMLCRIGIVYLVFWINIPQTPVRYILHRFRILFIFRTFKD
jgi:hypothetical protein